MATTPRHRRRSEEVRPRIGTAHRRSGADLLGLLKGCRAAPLGEILQNPALEAVRFATRYVPGLVHRTRGATRSMLRPILKTASFGDENVSPSVVAFLEKMIQETSSDAVEFLHALEVHDESAALPVLARVPVLIACGDRDLLTPLKHSEEMAAALPRTANWWCPEPGIVPVQMEQPDIINAALVRLVERATPSPLMAFTRRLWVAAMPPSGDRHCPASKTPSRRGAARPRFACGRRRAVWFRVPARPR